MELEASQIRDHFDCGPPKDIQRIQRATMGVTLIDTILEGALSEVEEPAVAKDTAVKLGYVRNALTELLLRFKRRFLSTQPLKLNVHFCKINSQETQSPVCVFGSSPPKIGVFPLTANPIHWGHVIASLAAIDALQLDTMIFLPAGHIDYKPVSDSDDVSEHDRHVMVRNAIKVFYPILQYTDVALGTDKPGECAIHDLRKLNACRKLSFTLVWGAENETRVRRIMSQTLACLHDQPPLTPGSCHSLRLVFIDGVGQRATDVKPERLQDYQTQIGLYVACQFLTINIPELAPFRSGNYRISREAALVPRVVHQYVSGQGLYT
jgi:hypothetical protein